LTQEGKFDEAHAAFERSLALLERRLGPDHTNVAQLLGNMAGLYQYEGKYEQAMAINPRVLAITTASAGPSSPAVPWWLTNIAEEELPLGRHEDALRDLRHALDLKEALGKDSRELAETLGFLGEALARTGHFDEAEATLGRGRAILEKTGGAQHPLYA